MRNSLQLLSTQIQIARISDHAYKHYSPSKNPQTRRQNAQEYKKSYNHPPNSFGPIHTKNDQKTQTVI